MAVKIRLRRMGNKNRPFYRLIVADSRSPRDGRFIEQLGHYDPLAQPAKYDVNEERALYWMLQGAGVSDTARSLLKKTGVLEQLRNARAEMKQQKAGPAAAPASATDAIAQAAESIRASQPEEAPQESNE